MPASRYLSSVASLSKLLLLMTMLLVPLGMSPAAAMAHHSPAAAMPMRHCPEQGSKHQSKAGFAECTMACSAALPATDIDAERPSLNAPPSITPGAQHALRGLHPDTATPPPKVS